MFNRNTSRHDDDNMCLKRIIYTEWIEFDVCSVAFGLTMNDL